MKLFFTYAVNTLLMMLIFSGIVSGQNPIEVLSHCKENFEKYAYIQWSMQVANYYNASDKLPVDTSTYYYKYSKNGLSVKSRIIEVLKTKKFSLTVNHLLRRMDYFDMRSPKQSLDFDYVYKLQHYDISKDTIHSDKGLQSFASGIVDTCDEKTIEVFLFPKRQNITRIEYSIDRETSSIRKMLLYFNALQKDNYGEKVLYSFRDYRFSDKVPSKAFSVDQYLKWQSGKWQPRPKYKSYQLTIH